MECPVCFEVYGVPLLLPGCGHTICKTCAEALITDQNFLRCPECRLVYQLRQGIRSLPKNVALERTIDEQVKKSENKAALRCDDHPDDVVALYCKTCEKSICLKCYFASNTLRKGQSFHVGHDVDTSEDAFSKEKRLLEVRVQSCSDIRKRERDYVNNLEETTTKLKDLLDTKTADIEQNKNEIITQVKQTSGKLKFTLNGSVAKDQEYLQMALSTSKERLARLEDLLSKAELALLKATRDEEVQVNVMMELRKQLEELREPDESQRPKPETFLKIQNFDTDLQACLNDPRKALSYQTEAPRVPEILLDECIISDTKACIVIQYDQQIRVKVIHIHYKEAMYKGFSEKQWHTLSTVDFSKGHAQVIIKDLIRATMYRIYATASNDFGESVSSQEMWFRTVDNEVEIRKP